MNFRTTILLLVVLIAAAAVYFFTGTGDPAPDIVKPGDADKPGKPLLDIAGAASVNKISVTPASGPRIAFEREGTSEWRLVEPVKAAADAFKVDDLVREVLELRTTGRTNASGKGLDQPQYVIEITDKDKKTTKLNVGNRSAVGDILYARVGSSGQADVVSASIVEQLDKPVSEYRKQRLLTVTNDKIIGVTVTEGDKTLKLAKSGEKWEILEPKQMSGDSGQISTLLSAITGLDAVKFIAEDLKDAATYGFAKPQMTVTFNTAPPETQPASTATTKPTDGAVTTIKFGRADDVLQKNVYAVVSDAGPVVTVAATALDSFRKTPLDLRNREVLNLDANAVSRLSISTEKPPTTQPTTQPAKKVQIVLERRSEATAPAATKPTTGPATKATTAPATTQPSLPQTKWLLASNPKGDADDTKVQALLDALRPLQAEKFLETFPTTQAAPAGTFVVKISTRSWGDDPAREHELKITDPGGDKKLLGQLGDLTFELDRALLEKLSAEFAAPKIEPAGPVFPGPIGPAAPELPTIPPIQ